MYPICLKYHLFQQSLGGYEAFFLNYPSRCVAPFANPEESTEDVSTVLTSSEHMNVLDELSLGTVSFKIDEGLAIYTGG